MKPRNFAGRRALRQERAKARQEHRPMPQGTPQITDIKVRIGGKKRRAA